MVGEGPGTVRLRLSGRHRCELMPPDEAKDGWQRSSPRSRQKKLRHQGPGEQWNTVGKDGERIWLLTNGVPILDEAGDLKGYRGV